MLKNIELILKRTLPVAEWLPHYDAEKAISDLVAGVTVGLTLIPQSLAYAALAGLSPEYGLYASMCGGFVYTIFGTAPQLNIAPTALLSLLTLSYTSNAKFGAVPAAILLCLLSGVIALICGILHLGFLLDFVSTPVVAGFTSAGAVTIASAQAKNLLGLNFSAESFLDIWTHVFMQIQETKKWDAILSGCCCVLLLGLRQIKDLGTPPISGKKDKGGEKSHNTWKVLVWFVSVARNAIVVIGCAVMAYVMDLHQLQPFSLTTKVQPGLPNVSVPLFKVTNQNETYVFVDMVKELGSGIVVVPFVAILGNVAIAKAFARGKMVDASQEMVAVGLCNIIGSFFSSMPVNASFARAAVSNASGIRTPIGGIYTGTMVVLALTFLTPYFSYIPKATLGSVIVCAVIFMVEVSIIKPIWKINKIDWIPLWSTFIACLLLGIEIGILIGVLIDVILVMYYNARPQIMAEKISEHGVDYIKILPTSAILFPSAEYARQLVMKSNVELGKNNGVIVLDCSRINRTDYTSVKCIALLRDDLMDSGVNLLFFKVDARLAQVLVEASSVPITFIDTEEELLDTLKRLSSPSVPNIKNNEVLISHNHNINVVHNATTEL